MSHDSPPSSPGYGVARKPSRFWPALSVAALVLALAACGLALWCLFGESRPLPVEDEDDAALERQEEEEWERPDRLVLTPARFDALPDWQSGRDDLAEALAVFLDSCSRMRHLPSDRPMDPVSLGATAADWKRVCERAALVEKGDRTAARRFFETALEPFQVRNHRDPVGLFTGYFEPTLNGSRRRHGPYQHPLYRRPGDLVSVDLGLFRDEWKGRRFAGRVKGRSLLPYADRAEIEAGGLAGRKLELLWVDDPIDAFFLHIQGSGRVELDDGSSIRVGYAGQNGHEYLAIGRELVERGEMTLEEVSMQSIRRWLVEHPREAEEVMAANRSFVFFREIDGDGPVGSQGVVLTPGRSLAVDRTFHPLGAPFWLDVSVAAAEEAGEPRQMRRLLVAQDTGGAIRGPVRGDLYWGHGDRAAAIAGRMKHAGRMWILVPAHLRH